MVENSEISWLVVSIVNGVMSLLFASYLTLFFIARKKIISYMRGSFDEQKLKSFGLFADSPSRYAKWGDIFAEAKANDPVLLKQLNSFRSYQLGAGDSFVIWLSLQILLIWFFKKVI